MDHLLEISMVYAVISSTILELLLTILVLYNRKVDVFVSLIKLLSIKLVNLKNLLSMKVVQAQSSRIQLTLSTTPTMSLETIEY